MTEETIPIRWRSKKYNSILSGLGQGKIFLIQRVYIKYESSDDFTLSVNVTMNGRTQTIEIFCSKDKNEVIRRFPPAIVCTEYDLLITGDIETSFELKEVGIIVKPIVMVR